MADADRKRELIAQLDRARSRAAAHREQLGHDLQVGTRVKGNIKESVDHHRGIWLGSAAMIGLIISKIPPRTKVLISGGGTKVPKEAKQAGKAGLLLAALGWAFNMLRPMLISWGTKRLQQAMAGGAGRGSYRRI